VRVKFEGSYTFAAPREVVWEMLQDPDVLSVIIPGSEKLVHAGENHYEATMTIQVGPVKGRFSGSVSLTDLNPPASYHMNLSGRGPAGHMNGSGNVRLESEGTSTVLVYEGEAQVGGRIAAVGQRLLDTAARMLAKQSLDGLAKHIQAHIATGQ
jgi:hypothetical protein